MDYEFTSVLDLKARIKPALDSKVKEMQRKNISKRIFDIDFFLTRWDNMRGGKCLISCIATKKRISYF